MAVIGAGLAGLTAAFDLGRAGHRVTVLEAAPDFGGLASSICLESHPIERFYHFICRSDHHLLELVEELGLGDRLHWRQTRTAFYHDGQMYSFGTPFDLLTFSAVPWLQRFRFGLHVLRSRYRSHWRWLDQIPAKPWLIENIGEEAYQVIWHPLLRIKFGEQYEKVSAAWVWHRIWRVAQSRRRLWERELFGYLENGSVTLVNGLIERLRAMPNVELRAGVRVRPLEVRDGRVGEVRFGEECADGDAVISTIALPGLDRLVPGQDSAYFANARTIPFIGVVCALFSLTRPLTPNFWLNINDSRISFNGIIEFTNLNHNLRAAGLNVIYIPFYLPTFEPRYNSPDEALVEEYTSLLPLINPDFEPSWIKEWHIFRSPYAQAICTTNFADRMPEHRTPIQGLYVTDSTQFYPEDRTISAAIHQGRRVARMIAEDHA